MEKLKHLTNGWVFDKTRKQFQEIENISSICDNYDVYVNNVNTIPTYKYSLRFVDKSFTHYLTVKELDEFYPYVGTNIEAIEVLYGK